LPQTALIIGASRGLGLALAEEYLKRGWAVTATVRGEKPTPLHAIANPALTIEHVDINDEPGVAALKQRLQGQTFDLLFVNAGVSNGHGERLVDTTTEAFIRVMVTNGTIAVMSSGLGSVANNDRGGWEIYRASKASLNTLMRSFAATRAGDPRTLLTLAPGWVRTDMGGPNAALSIEESIPNLVNVITNQSGKPGLQYLNYEGLTLPW
jgi:NAD(P)-dependent dehydrogenase (short-subunit alcohol dehydrogenase family)